MAFTQVTLTGKVLLSNATPAAGASITLTLSTPITDGTQIVAPEQVTVRCASDGTFTTTVNANDDNTTSPTGSYYQVALVYGSQTLDTFNVVVPAADSPTVNLFTLAQLPNPNPAGLPFVSKIVAGTNVTISPTGGTGTVTVNATGGGAVSSVFTRTGAVTAQSGDYNVTQIAPAVVVVTQSATPAIDTDNGGLFVITGLAQAITSMTTNLTGTPVQGQFWWAKITANGTARAITWGAKFASTAAVALPTITDANLPLWVLFTWDSINSVWNPVAGGSGSGGDTITSPDGSITVGGTSAATTLQTAATVAKLASPTFTGTPAAPTPTVGDNTTKLATTAFVLANSVQTVTSPDGSVTIGGTSTAPTFEVAAPGWLPSDNGLLVAAFDPVAAAGSNLLIKGTLYLARLSIHASCTLSTLWFRVAGAGSGASSGSFVGLYSSAGTLLTGSADIGTTLAAGAANVSIALTTPQAVTTGTFVWAALLSSLATTQPTVGSAANGLFPAWIGQTATNARFATNGTLLSALPGTITPSSNATSAFAWFAGAS